MEDGYSTKYPRKWTNTSSARYSIVQLSPATGGPRKPQSTSKNTSQPQEVRGSHSRSIDYLPTTGGPTESKEVHRLPPNHRRSDGVTRGPKITSQPQEVRGSHSRSTDYLPATGGPRESQEVRGSHNEPMPQ